MLLLQHCFTVLACPFPAIPRTHAPHSIIPLSFPSGHVGLQFLRLLYRTVKSYKKLLVSLYTSKYANDVYPTHFPQFTGLISASAGRDTRGSTFRTPVLIWQSACRAVTHSFRAWHKLVVVGPGGVLQPVR